VGVLAESSQQSLGPVGNIEFYGVHSLCRLSTEYYCRQYRLSLRFLSGTFRNLSGTFREPLRNFPGHGFPRILRWIYNFSHRSYSNRREVQVNVYRPNGMTYFFTVFFSHITSMYTPSPTLYNQYILVLSGQTNCAK
jgi:hypothetical protein